MLFNSPLFMFGFLPASLLGFHFAARIGKRAPIAWLVFMSFLFYGVWRYQFVLLLIGSVSVNYCFARLIFGSRHRPGLQRKLLLAGVSCNLGLLFYYKYLFPALAGLGRIVILHHQFAGVVLPLGISFFTFTQIAYLVDLQQGAAEPEDFLNYALFVTFFPHLIAGPILHHGEMMPQFRKPTLRLNAEDLSIGFTWFIMGLFKKVVLADSIAGAADAAFAAPGALTLVPSWLGLLNYFLQLYFDFSGYSDMAIGLARMFSIRFPLNFDSPYKATSIIDFWARWHMTLTRYVTVYLYNPVSMWVNRRRLKRGKKVSRKGSRTIPGFAEMVAFPTLFSMILIGVWHGAGYQFLIFGLLHGLYITVNHAWRIFGPGNKIEEQRSWIHDRAQAIAYGGLTLLAVMVGQVFFRANSTHDAFTMLGGMVGLHGCRLPALTTMLASFVRIPIRLAIIWFLPNTQQILGILERKQTESTMWGSISRKLQWQPTIPWAIVMTLALVMSLTWMQDTTRFLYFQF